jgi:basic amino acid/polyamine antiporter, APA family
LVNATWLKIYPAQVVSMLLILFLTYINTRGVKTGKLIQTTFTVIKIASLFGLIVFGFLLTRDSSVWDNNWNDAWTMQKRITPTDTQSVVGLAVLGAIAASMVGSIFSSDSWNNVTFIAGEIKNPKRNIGLSLFLGTLLVTIIYVAANLMYITVLPLQDIAFAPADRVAISAANVIFGNIGTYLVAVMIMISTFGCNNGLVLAGARVYYSMARDGLFFRPAGVLNRHAVPEWALWAQGIVASLLCLSGKYGDLLDMVSFMVVLFYVLTIIGIFILRRKRPDADRPYKAFGYPFLPAVYVLMGISFCVLLIMYKPGYTWPGLLITLAGIPLYFIAVARKRSR